VKNVAVAEPSYTRVAWNKPFIKWAGGKTQLLPTLLQMVPKKFDFYFEPFVGGGALFFALGRKVPARLSDVNAELMNTYSQVRYNLPKLIIHLKEHQRAYRSKRIGSHSGEEYLYEVRSWKRPINRDPVAAAARFIFLNKTCFNGLYRINKKGLFNVPHGKFSSPPNICDVETLQAASMALAKAIFISADFEHMFNIAAKNRGSFLYADPPYAPLNETSDFTSYTKGGFNFADQERLRNAAVAAHRAGVKMLISNSNAPSIVELYSDTKHFEIIEVDARRNVNSDGAKRGPVKELIIKTKGW
jgi:DNA adenine methylase